MGDYSNKEIVAIFVEGGYAGDKKIIITLQLRLQSPEIVFRFAPDNKKSNQH